jgi:hypothetical protein
MTAPAMSIKNSLMNSTWTSGIPNMAIKLPVCVTENTAANSPVQASRPD